jgi:hypothetical protein
MVHQLTRMYHDLLPNMSLLEFQCLIHLNLHEKRCDMLKSIFIHIIHNIFFHFIPKTNLMFSNNVLFFHSSKENTLQNDKYQSHFFLINLKTLHEILFHYLCVNKQIYVMVIYQEVFVILMLILEKFYLLINPNVELYEFYHLKMQ